ncbi:MAG: VanZ family protein [Firmicutes bacterium]|nr:VanZ family protein [Bacillota bacterium]
MIELEYYIYLLSSYITLPFIGAMTAITIVLTLLLLRTKIEKKGLLLVGILYCLALFYFSTFTRASYQEYLIRPIPFWSYYAAFTIPDWYLLIQNGLNILLFFPIGFFLSISFSKKKAFKLGILYCLLIEISQFILQRGYFDVDDILHNGIGLVLGILCWEWVKKLLKQEKYVLTRYDFNRGEEPIKIFMMSDLHEFKVDHYLKEIEKQKPDLILLVGDVLERREGHKHQKKSEYKGNWFFYRLAWFIDDVLEFFFGTQDRKSEYSFQFLEQARKLAPIIYSRGNHERDMLESDFAFLREKDILFLDNQDTIVEIKGRKIRIGGLSTNIDSLWLESYSKKPGYKILMMHHPEYYEELPCLQSFDLVLSGHAHGGQIRIADQGLFSPGQGLLPKITKGLYFGNHVVSTGCTNTSLIPRIGNPKEVVYIEI